MNRDKQIEEMTKLICSTCQRELDPCGSKKPCRSAIAECNDLYNAGYRKASDVAREIFEEIEELIYSKCFSVRANRDVTGLIIDGEMFTELKKKYTEDCDGQAD